MYQINIKVKEKKAFWIYALGKIIGERVKSLGGIAAIAEIGDSCNIAIACENSRRFSLERIVRDGITELVSTVCKMCYIDGGLKHLNLHRPSYRLLLHTLVAFDRECERKILSELVCVSRTMSLDGIYDFRIGELKKRWDEICSLITGNAAFLHDEMTLNELLRFLISAINPKIMKLEVRRKDGEFLLTGRREKTDFRLSATDCEDLMLYLIDLAPIELEICGELEDRELHCRLVEVFDAKVRSDFEIS